MRSKKNLKVPCSKHTTNILSSSAGSIDPYLMTSNPYSNTNNSITLTTLLDFFPNTFIACCVMRLISFPTKS